MDGGEEDLSEEREQREPEVVPVLSIFLEAAAPPGALALRMQPILEQWTGREREKVESGRAQFGEEERKVVPREASRRAFRPPASTTLAAMLRAFCASTCSRGAKQLERRNAPFEKDDKENRVTLFAFAEKNG